MQNQHQTPLNNQNPKSSPPQLIKAGGTKNVDFSELLNDALSNDTLVNDAYRAFHNYSFLNQILAASQLFKRFGKLSPIASYKSWQEKGRQVRKGEKGIALFLPVTKKIEIESKTDTNESTEAVFTKFILKNNWFALDQTEGEAFIPELFSIAWDANKAMSILNIIEVSFDSICGNTMGYAKDNEIAINPLNPLKHKTRFHEMAHILLGHTAENTLLSDDERTPKHIREIEAEGVAFMMTSILELDGIKQSRHYIQSWLQTEKIPNESARKIFTITDKLLKAGQ